MKAKRIAYLGLAAACAIIFSYVEFLLPPLYQAVPGVKIGLANVVTVYLLYRDKLKSAAAVTLIRIAVVALLFGNVMTLSYSIVGAALSITVMALLKKTGAFSTVGVSIAGGVSHNLGQILTAMVIMQTAEIGYYFVVLAVTGILAGVAVGVLGALLIKHTAKLKF